MSKLDDFVKSGTPLGIVIGIGATVLATAVIPVLPALARAARPTARAALKSGLVLAEKGRELIAEASEEFEDILAEARAELRQDNAVRWPESATPAENSARQDDL